MSNLSFEDYDAKCKAMGEVEAEVASRNKAALFDALTAAGIATITIEFEGSGDSGQMEHPCARAADETIVPIPTVTIETERADWNDGVLKETTVLSEVVESLAWHLLGNTHGGWEIGDGGYGEFTFDVTNRTIRLEYNERYTETNYHDHEF